MKIWKYESFFSGGNNSSAGELIDFLNKEKIEDFKIVERNPEFISIIYSEEVANH